MFRRAYRCIEVANLVKSLNAWVGQTTTKSVPHPTPAGDTQPFADFGGVLGSRVPEALSVAPLRLLAQPDACSQDQSQEGPYGPSPAHHALGLACPALGRKSPSTSIPRMAIHRAACRWAAAVPRSSRDGIPPFAVAASRLPRPWYRLN